MRNIQAFFKRLRFGILGNVNKRSKFDILTKEKLRDSIINYWKKCLENCIIKCILKTIE